MATVFDSAAVHGPPLPCVLRTIAGSPKLPKVPARSVDGDAGSTDSERALGCS